MPTDHLDRVDEILQSSQYGNLQFVKRLEYNLNCNWKVFVDNYLDGGMHVKYAHPNLAANLDLKSYSTEVHDKYSVQRASAAIEEGQVRVKGRADYVYVYPNLMINRYGDWMDTNLVIPLNSSQCVVRMDYYLEQNKVEQKEWIEESLVQSDQVQKEDIWLCETVQKGLESTAYSVGRYAPTVEHGMHDFHKTLFRELSQK
jgi:choline monooxygenase